MSASVRCPRLGLGLLALATSACALTGYDFGDYERAAVSSQAGSSGASGTAGQTGGTEPDGPSPFGVGLSAGGDRADDGGATGAGGDRTGDDGAAGAGGDRTDGGAGGAEAACEPQSCFALGLQCGLGPSDGCGQPLDCGGCFWWFQECRQNQCEIPE